MESRFEAQYGTDNEDFSSMLRSLQSLDLEGGTNKKARVRRAGTEFASHYGSDARVTKRWQALCQDCGVNLVPSSINQCKKVQSLQRCARRDPRGRIHANVSFRSLGTQRCEYQHLSFPRCQKSWKNPTPFSVEKGVGGVHGRKSRRKISLEDGEAEQVLECTSHQKLVTRMD